MKAIVLHQPGSIAALQIQEVAKPTLQPEEVLVQVKAISINPVDVKSRAGKGVYGRIKEQQPLILGWDISGVVTESNSSAFKVGQEVFGMVNFPGHGKAYAEYVAAPASHLALKPSNITHEEAAAATLAALTAYQVLLKQANVQAGQQVLVHAAAGGVGHYAVQIAKHLGAYVVGSSSDKNKEQVLQLGADGHINYHGYDWGNSPYQFDTVLDTIGGDNIDHSLEVTKAGGTIVSIPSGLNEAVTEKAKAKGVNGYFYLVQSDGEDMKVIADYLQQGIIRSVVSQTFAFDEMGKAHEQVESGRTVGKVVVTL
ncbi:NADPH:quinone reductase [Filimonas lacunae]|uniref:NADPH:quinone reductase n=1 Tax=Filimonas lacunae TaxID=477680 RepID=A0A173MGM7_9BACT|nr:NADP-dependent oxidoreductase [Filimonas lacunae]BAV06627.1 bifunctional protein: zinc-containing alcohol dehydrogenase [Filimonas lacunae]SIT27648.1 NADPH:quinone reductase [Filimonas lacunae]